VAVSSTAYAVSCIITCDSYVITVMNTVSKQIYFPLVPTIVHFPDVFLHRNLNFFSVSITYRGADKSLARPTSRCILFDGEIISFDVSLVIYINSTNIPPIMIINRIHENQNLVAVAFFLPVRAKDLSASLYNAFHHC
jgi:hypothetical protein